MCVSSVELRQGYAASECISIVAVGLRNCNCESRQPLCVYVCALHCCGFEYSLASSCLVSILCTLPTIQAGLNTISSSAVCTSRSP